MSKVLVYEGLVSKLIEIYTEFVTDEIAMATNVETRYANNVAMGQQEVLAVIGSLLLSRNVDYGIHIVQRIKGVVFFDILHVRLFVNDLNDLMQVIN